MIPFALTVKLGRYSRERIGTRSIVDALRRFSVQRQLSLLGTLEAVVVISNSFLAQCPQKPNSGNLERHRKLQLPLRPWGRRGLR
jgi:hypothetical protein